MLGNVGTKALRKCNKNLAAQSGKRAKLSKLSPATQNKKLSNVLFKMGAWMTQRNYSNGAKFPEELTNNYRTEDAESSKTYNYFILGLTGAACVNTGKNLVVPFLSSMSASADVLAMANVEVDLSSIKEGTSVIVKWRGKPLFIRNRTPSDIEAAESVDLSELRDPEPDSARYRGPPQYLVLLGICTHLGCVPIDGQGDYGGWYCPCHGSHYDTSGRIRKGPAPLNLEIPPYKFLDDTHILVGQNE